MIQSSLTPTVLVPSLSTLCPSLTLPTTLDRSHNITMHHGQCFPAQEHQPQSRLLEKAGRLTAHAVTHPANSRNEKETKQNHSCRTLVQHFKSLCTSRAHHGQPCVLPQSPLYMSVHAAFECKLLNDTDVFTGFFHWQTYVTHCIISYLLQPDGH